MTDQNPRANIGLLALAGIGAGALTGVLIGWLALRRPQVQAQAEISETVEDLKRRAELILSELSRADAPGPADQSQPINRRF